ncbi:TIGR00730 family Rossman fold protein [Micromonospora tulbaghiae]|uniref:LOG family protein n=1 Tax=Micromonospora tulbaghiae TaxID=479978 RepID=UPI001FD46CA3|nr:TIGR00730 family Rossman fold protein [Micromonospora tulbaghiae]
MGTCGGSAACPFTVRSALLRYLTVFCGASPGHRDAHREAAVSLGASLAAAGYGLVYGGASTGLMGAVADAALAAGAPVVGVIPRGLVQHEIAHRGLTGLHIVDTMHERKALMAQLGDGFVVMPGGFGTLEETFEILTWTQLGLHEKPCALLNVAGYWTPLLLFLRHAAEEGFVHRRFLDNIAVCDAPDEALRRLTAYRPLPHLFAPVSVEA